MLTRSDVAGTLRLVRERRGLTQEDFSTISSRTYMSSLERGQSSPTLEKLMLLCDRLGVHPVSLFALAAARSAGVSAESILELAAEEINALTS